MKPCMVSGTQYRDISTYFGLHNSSESCTGSQKLIVAFSEFYIMYKSSASALHTIPTLTSFESGGPVRVKLQWVD